MISLKQQISALEEFEWNYYSEKGDQILKNPFTSQLSHTDFVKKYFDRSGKNSVLDFINYLPNGELNNDRMKHTSSIFFLGVLIYNRTDLRSDFFENLNTAEYRRFPFLWFLTCLFHDFGFDIESDETAYIGIHNLDDLKKKYSINHCLLETKPNEVSTVLFSDIEKYFNFRLKNGEIIDHGIFAALFFFDRLIKNRRSKFETNDELLFWGEELEEQYAQVATTIAVHNIWLPKTIQDIKEYEKYKLNNIITGFSPIKFNDFPLLYILGIVDTIDPVKIYMRDGFTPNEILDNIDLKFNGNEVTFKNGSNSKLDFTKMIQSAKGLKGWIDVKRNYSDCELILTLG